MRLICQAALSEKASYTSISAKFKVTRALVGRLVKRYKTSSSFIDDLRETEVNRRSKARSVYDQVAEILARGHHIWRTQQVVAAVRQNTNTEVKRKYVATVMKQCCDMTYRKVKFVPCQTNSDRNLVMRHLCARKLLTLLKSGTRILNIDQSWLNEAEFRRRKWCPRSESNSVKQWAVRPRVSLFVAIDTEGRIYFSISIVPTDSEVFCLFIS